MGSTKNSSTVEGPGVIMHVIVEFSENGVNSLSFAEFEENSIYYMHDSA